MTIREEWESFAKDVIPPDAPAVQHIECRRAFYAGAWALLQGLKGMDEGVSEDEGATQSQRLEDEMRAFRRAVTEGRA